jgi:hypothetical protein
VSDISLKELPGPDDLPLTEGRPDQTEPPEHPLGGPHPDEVKPADRQAAAARQWDLLRPLRLLTPEERHFLYLTRPAPQVSSEAVVAALQGLLGMGENPPGSNCNAITARCGLGCCAWCDEGWHTALFNAGFNDGAGHFLMPGVDTDYWFGDAYVPDTMRHYQVAGRFSKTPVPGAGGIHYWSGPNNPGDSHIEAFIQPYPGTGTHLNIECNHNNVCEYVKRADNDSTLMGYCIPLYSAAPVAPRTWPFEVE